MAVENSDQSVVGNQAKCPSWESLGSLVQARTLAAVSQHFFELGVAEWCMDAVRRMETEVVCADAPGESAHPRELMFEALDSGGEGDTHE